MSHDNIGSRRLPAVQAPMGSDRLEKAKGHESKEMFAYAALAQVPSSRIPVLVSRMEHRNAPQASCWCLSVVYCNTSQ